MFKLLKRYQHDLRAARQRLAAGSQVYSTPAGRIEAALTGCSTGESVLIAHGSGGGYDMGLWLARLLGGAYQYIAPSRFGYLRSPVPPDSSPAAQDEGYIALLDQLGVQRAVMVGLSGGGPSALQFALRRPERCRALLLLSAYSAPIPPLPPILQAIYPWMLRSDFIPWLFYTSSPGRVYQANGLHPALLARIRPDPEKMRLLEELYWTTFPSTLRRAGMLNDAATLTHLPAIPLERIRVPTLVVHALNDPIIPFATAQRTASTIPNARFLPLQDGGHFAIVTHKEQVLPEIQSFCADRKNKTLQSASR
jgi:pimeloyl-ACP methyl ester carboxylesterase